MPPLARLVLRAPQALWSEAARPSIARELRRCLDEGRTDFSLAIPTRPIFRRLLEDVMEARARYARIRPSARAARTLGVVMPVHDPLMLYREGTSVSRR